jgi:hypothetical protein
MTQASSLFEEILIKPKDMLDKETLLEALHAAAGPYKELEVFNSELMTLHSQHVPPSKRARSGNGKGKKEPLHDKIKAINDKIKDTGKGSAKDKSKESGKGNAKNNSSNSKGNGNVKKS